MKVRNYMQHLLGINLEILPNLPPFKANQNIGDDEMLDIILYGTPKGWQKEMERQGFDPMLKTVNDVVTFMERIEATEDFDVNAAKSNKVNKMNKKKSPSSTKKDSEKEERKFNCDHHGPNNAHNSEQCFVLHPELKKDKKNNSKNKSWSREASENKEKAKDNFAFIQKEVAKAMKAHDKKRKASEEESDDDDLNAFDLKEFNYNNMDNLKIDSDDDGVSV